CRRFGLVDGDERWIDSRPFILVLAPICVNQPNIPAHFVTRAGVCICLRRRSISAMQPCRSFFHRVSMEEPGSRMTQGTTAERALRMASPSLAPAFTEWLSRSLRNQNSTDVATALFAMPIFLLTPAISFRGKRRGLLPGS